MGLLGILIAVVWVIIGIMMTLYIFAIVGIDPMTLYVSLTMGMAVGCAFIFNVKSPQIMNSEKELK